VAAQFGPSSFSGHGYALQISQQPVQGQASAVSSGSNQAVVAPGPSTARSSEQVCIEIFSFFVMLVIVCPAGFHDNQQGAQDVDVFHPTRS
jgi:hypothetical protein